MSTGCGVISKYLQSDADSLAKESQSNYSETQMADAEKCVAELIEKRHKGIDAMDCSDFLKKLLKDGVSTHIQTPMDYQINYTWKDIDIDKINLSSFEKYGYSSTEFLDTFNTGEVDDCIVSQWEGYFDTPFEKSVTLKSYKEMNADYKIVYNDGRAGFVEENEVLLPKWTYYAEYLATSGELKCSLDDMHKVLADDYILQKYLFLGADYITNIEHYKYFMPDERISLAIAFAYYGLLDITKTKDMTIQVKGYYDSMFGQNGGTYDLSVIGYFETPMDKIFERALTANEDYENIGTYLFFNRVMYLK